uniref:Uncharacterized protein n=1 Tax=Setaria viridis TaxID=4556 RepID=A0A4U6U4E6_SETVI|nr:hypothetical protein SEVIR_6G167450v2 [Setaria viridis]
MPDCQSTNRTSIGIASRARMYPRGPVTTTDHSEAAPPAPGTGPHGHTPLSSPPRPQADAKPSREAESIETKREKGSPKRGGA